MTKTASNQTSPRDGVAILGQTPSGSIWKLKIMTNKISAVTSIDALHSFRGKPHHRRGRFVSPPSPHTDGRRSWDMAGVLWELVRFGNAPVEYDDDHRWSDARALAALEHHNDNLDVYGLENVPEDGAQDETPGAAQDRQLALTWLGQSCFYFHLGGMGIITDPFLGKRASPFGFSGPKRLVASPLSIRHLKVDVIVMSHNHYDHFCVDTLAQIDHKSQVAVITTLGLAPLFRKLGFRRIVELDWYEQVEVGLVTFIGLPAYHFSGRRLWDMDKTLWASFGIAGPEAKLFFAGDTGYGPAFKEMGELTGPYDLALVPIGAYAPRRVFASVHASPEEAVSMGRDLNAARLVGMHWGTVRLTTEPFWEPKAKFLAHPEGPERTVMAIGETRKFRL